VGEYVIKIDFVDEPGLGYEIFKSMENSSIDKIAMEVIPEHGMVIKFLSSSSEQTAAVIKALKEIPGICAVTYCEQMPYEEREWELKAILNSVSEGILAINQKGKITHINEVACRMFHCIPQSVTGRSVTEILGENPPVLDTLLSGNIYKLQECRIRREGRTIRFFASCEPVRNEKGQIIGAVSTIKDFRQVEKMLAKVDKMRNLNGFEDIVYQSESMSRLIKSAKTVAKSSSTILLRGESGTGKELFACAIHTEGARYRGPFIAVNCTALPDTLLESELFGYEEGAFTGALKGGKKGLFEQADTGTLFLDEIGEISPQVQARLLRVLQTGKIRKVGGDKETQVDVRIIAATHRNLEDMLHKGEFREDLYYRLNVIPLTIPPLRQRAEDIPLLAQHLIRKICVKLERPEVRLNKDSVELLMAQVWPGNVRQLENTLERVINLSDAEEILPRHLADWCDVGGLRNATEKDRAVCMHCVEDEHWPKLKEIVAEAEKEVLMRVWKKYPSSRRAAQVLGVSNTTILNKMRSYGLY
jgi:transcriptional regulator of aroF, aroG, tyrA and aromatic amino acid transport